MSHCTKCFTITEMKKKKAALHFVIYFKNNLQQTKTKDTSAEEKDKMRNFLLWPVQADSSLTK